MKEKITMTKKNLSKEEALLSALYFLTISPIVMGNFSFLLLIYILSIC